MFRMSDGCTLDLGSLRKKRVAKGVKKRARKKSSNEVNWMVIKCTWISSSIHIMWYILKEDFYNFLLYSQTHMGAIWNFWEVFLCLSLWVFFSIPRNGGNWILSNFGNNFFSLDSALFLSTYNSLICMSISVFSIIRHANVRCLM